MVKISEEDFYNLRCGCPIHECTYGAKCRLIERQCDVSCCPFVYWYEVLGNPVPEVTINIPKMTDEEWADIKEAGQRMREEIDKRGDL